MTSTTATAARTDAISVAIPQFRPYDTEHPSTVRVKIGETLDPPSNPGPMSRASRPDLRSSRRSRRRQAVFACGGLCYLAAVFAGLFALASLFVPMSHLDIWALIVAGGIAFVGAVLAIVDAALAPRGDSASPLSPHIA
jgi:hypothetical protein